MTETKTVFNSFVRDCHEEVGGFEADLVGRVGVGGLVRGVGVGGFRDAIPGGDSGGKGAESNQQRGGKVLRFEAVGRNGGIGVDSSEEEFGLVGVAGNGFGGVVKSEERIPVGTEERRDCGLQGSCCGGLKGSFCGGSSIDVKSHMQFFLDTIVDLRQMYESKYILLNSQVFPPRIVDKLCRPLDNFSRSAEPVVTQRLARSAEPVVTHNRQKNVRFEINNNNDSRYNNNSKNNDDDCGGNSGVAVGTCY